MRIISFLLTLATCLSMNAQTTSWTADNGNGTFTNPLFYDEFSDPDILRVGDDFYLAGTTMSFVFTNYISFINCRIWAAINTNTLSTAIL